MDPDSQCSARQSAEQNLSPHLRGQTYTLLSVYMRVKSVLQHPHWCFSSSSSGTTRLFVLKRVAMAEPPPVGEASVHEIVSSLWACTASPRKQRISSIISSGLKACPCDLHFPKIWNSVTSGCAKRAADRHEVLKLVPANLDCAQASYWAPRLGCPRKWCLPTSWPHFGAIRSRHRPDWTLHAGVSRLPAVRRQCANEPLDYPKLIMVVQVHHREMVAARNRVPLFERCVGPSPCQRWCVSPLLGLTSLPASIPWGWHRVLGELCLGLVCRRRCRPLYVSRQSGDHSGGTLNKHRNHFISTKLFHVFDLVPRVVV